MQQLVENNLIFELATKGAAIDKTKILAVHCMEKIICTFSTFSRHTKVYCDTNMGGKEHEIKEEGKKRKYKTQKTTKWTCKLLFRI